MIVESAPAKINLYLHIGPVRGDGLHDLASLFVFAKDGDIVRAEKSHSLTLAITGPYADELSGGRKEENLVWRAAQLLQARAGVAAGAALTLEKNLPVAAGVGGGSADAAAALRALVRLWDLNISDAALRALAFTLGADVPACLVRAPVNVSGAGEKLTAGPHLPPLWCCLVNPRVPMPTGPIFRAFDTAIMAPATPVMAAISNTDYAAFVVSLEKTRNDLEPFAGERAPVIRDVLRNLQAAPGALIARMSGSGATCFALFASEAAAVRAAQKAASQSWWAMASPLHVR